MKCRRLILSAILVCICTPPVAATEKDKRSPAGAGGKRVTLNIARGDIGDALRLVAEQGGLNLVIGPEVKGEVSVYLSEASLDTALKAIAVNNGYNYTLDDGVITVSKKPEPTNPEPPPPLVTRVFNLRSQDAERVRDALEFALSKHGRMKVLNENSQAGYGVQRLSSLSGDFASTNAASATGSPPTFSNAAGVGGTAGAAGALPGLTTGPVQTANTPPRNARTLVVTDVKENVERIAELVADLDKLPPQVLIEARIVEMSTDLQRRLGIDWNVNALASGPILNHEWPLRNRAGFASGDQIRRRHDGLPFSTDGLALGTIDFSQFTALVQANQSDNAIRLLANPRLLVYNNHSASILVGERYPILQASISNFGTVTEAFSQYIPVGVQLEVTPTIMRDGKISLLVHPTTSVLGDDVVGTTGLRVARIRTRELDTRVIMEDGQTIVLGGLISDRKTHAANKVPGLGDVPVLDIFFRQENPRSERVDLLIFLTAQVEGAAEIDERDQQVYDMYKPHFKHIERLQDVPLHFEIPTEYQPPKPMFSDPPAAAAEEMAEADDAFDDAGMEEPDEDDAADRSAPSNEPVGITAAPPASVEPASAEPAAPAAELPMPSTQPAAIAPAALTVPASEVVVAPTQWVVPPVIELLNDQNDLSGPTSDIFAMEENSDEAVPFPAAEVPGVFHEVVEPDRMTAQAPPEKSDDRPEGQPPPGDAAEEEAARDDTARPPPSPRRSGLWKATGSLFRQWFEKLVERASTAAAQAAGIVQAARDLSPVVVGPPSPPVEPATTKANAAATLEVDTTIRRTQANAGASIDDAD